MAHWFRAYSETLNDPKVQTLPLASFKAWHNALYLASSLTSKDGNIGTIKAIAFAFRETVESVSSAFHPLVEAGLIETESETFHIVSWRKRQYKSDTSTDRVKQFRKRSRNVTETAPDTESETEQKVPLDKESNGAFDPEKVMFDSGIVLLGEAGKSEPQARAILGKWKRDHGAGLVIEAMGKAQREGAIEPVSFIEGCLRTVARELAPERPIC